ncbi:MAG: Vitamin B12 transporter BtuB [Nitrospirae bacterium]|nr:Vitamin B12 transporter BtuB [Nitrospirota bacterium]MCK6494253.1 TonB-dependent siderophore receptor [Nitrospira sp.]MEB2340110.1 TonB-dependent siderophore receptor [Nitrospirales bacterium]QOJ33992.1 MAG: TonB-dependent siderophore receptor [Nitrospira sp.]
MQFSWHIIIASVSAFLFQSAANLAEAGNNRLTTYEPRPFLLAQASPSGEPTETTEFNISPQPLGSAITTFADQANYRLLVPSEMTEGKTTNGVSGRHTPEEALTLLLTGTGLSYRLTDSRTMTLEPAGVTPLPPSPVAQATSPEPPNPNTQVQSGAKPVKVPEVVIKEVEDRGYSVDESSTATRIPAPIHDTPRSVEVVTRQVLDDQKVIRFSEALRNVSGVSQSSTQGGQGGTFMIRGFASELNVFKNGFRDDSTFSSRTQRDIINIESVEVVKGPPSYLYGRSDPGGVINQVTKAPLKNRYYSAEMIVGSYGLYRPQIDIGGPLNESKTLTYRFNGMYESAESYRDGVKSQRIFLAPTFGWEMSSRTTLRFEGEYLFDRSPIDRGLIAFGNGVAPIPISRFLGDPNRKMEVQQGKATITLWHEINDMFRWRTAFRAAAARSRYSSLESNFLVGAESDGILNLARYEIPTTVQSHYLQNELHGNFFTGSIKHKTIIGIELGRENSSATASGDFGGDTTTPGAFSYINIFNPNDRLFLNPTLTKFSDASQQNNILGAYVGDQVDLLDNLHMHFGGRFDLFDQTITNRPDGLTPTGSENTKTDTAFSPSVGIAYQPWKPITLYANYTESFAPQSAGSRSISGNLFDPERGKSYEGGVKYEAFGGKLRSTVAVFDIKKKNVLTADPLNGFFFSVATGEQRSKGAEFDISGQILPGWDIIANYAYIDTRVTKDLLFAEGSRAPNSALHQGSLWTTYFFQEGVVKGFGAGIGMYAQGKRNGIFQCQDPANCQAPFELAGYVRMDAALYYRKQEVFNKTNLLAAINFTNLLDHRYFSGAQNFREIVYTGAPFTAVGSLRFEFY